MSIRAKLLLLLGAIIALFGGGLLLLQMLSRKQFQAVTQSRWEERSEALNRVLEHWSEPLDTFVTDNTCLDDLVSAIEKNQPGWVEQAFPQSTLTSFRVHVLWIFRADRTLFAVRNNLYSPDLAHLPVDIEQVASRLMERKLLHFYAWTSRGIVEFRAATIHASRDSARAGPVHGYLLAGRLWTSEDLKEMSLFTGNTVYVDKSASGGASTPGPSHPPATVKGFELSSESSGDGIVTVRRQLPGWNGQPVATLYARNESPLMRAFHVWNKRVFVWLIAFACTVYLLLNFALHRWVIRPFRDITRSLRTEDPALLEPWRQDQGDVGKVARIVRTFFHQREALVKEMHDRRQVERHLHDREEELRHALKLEAIGRLAGGVAHDFNNLLTVIIGYATMLPKSGREEPAAQAGGIILQAAQKAAALTQQLLAFSRKQVLHPRVIDLNVLVTDMQKLLHRTLGEQIDLHVHPDAALGRVRADATQLEQVIVNLAINARDAMPRGGVLTISTQDALISAAPETSEESDSATATEPPPGRYVVLEVKDTGTGMDEATLAQIFEPFFTTKSAGRGTGLGLATVYGIVRQSGGRIKVASQQGIGTTFSVFLPLETAPLDPPPAPQPMPQNSTQREQILVADDDRTVRELICRVLQNHDFRVICAADCKEALEYASDKAHPLHLLITDVVMPIYTGPELAARIRAVRPDLPVLMVSGYASEQLDHLSALRPHADSLDKPFTPQDLLAKVFALLNAKQNADGQARSPSPRREPAAMV